MYCLTSYCKVLCKPLGLYKSRVITRTMIITGTIPGIATHHRCIDLQNLMLKQKVASQDWHSRLKQADNRKQIERLLGATTQIKATQQLVLEQKYARTANRPDKSEINILGNNTEVNRLVCSSKKQIRTILNSKKYTLI